MDSYKEYSIEQKLLDKLSTDLKYTYRPDIKDLESLEKNFREKFEDLNKVKLTDYEFERLLETIIKPDVFESSTFLREQHTLIRDDGTPLDYKLVHLEDWCKNSFEVINQLRINTKSSYRQYDVILLINGLPLVQIELKSLRVNPRRAMEQIIRYKNDPGNGYRNTLMSFMQIFIVSNQTDTWYFANNRNEHFRFDVNENFLPRYYWADPDNKKVLNLYEFSEKFLAKCDLAEMISRYMVLVQTERKILMMRPYQIYAVKEILKTIQENRGNGYIWHTTGSGKTLTSFKASTLMKENKNIEKAVFVVDRKDLDKQTREEFNKFQPGCVEHNTHTGQLVERLLSKDYRDKIIVTTIQKLGIALDGRNKKQYKKKLEPLRDKRMVFIFDECHRSQFGENHKAIKEFFPKAQLFGFTGTPIFRENASYQYIRGKQATFLTTEDVFEKRLHTYTITHAINDKNVLRFHVDYYTPTEDVDFSSPEFKREVVDTILEKHSAATNHRRFNALFATNSINDAIAYYQLFKQIQAERQEKDPDFIPLNITCVFTPPAFLSEEIKQLQEDLPQELADHRDKKDAYRKQKALEEIIQDYNHKFGTTFTIHDFDLYYQDVQGRIKDQKYPNDVVPLSKKLDITIVVDMLLTGFDSKYLNTLYVDKNLKYHRLIQAFSRTNRVLNDAKPYGNILDFRGQKEAVDEAIALFSGENRERAKEIWLVDPAPVVIEKFEKAVEELESFMQEYGLEADPSAVENLPGDEAKIQFIEKFKAVRKYHNQLDQYTDLTPEERQRIEQLMPKDKIIAFSTKYLEVAREFKEKQEKNPEDEQLQNIEFDLILFDTAVIDYDYIMRLIARFSQEPEKLKMTREDIIRLLESNAKFMDEKEDLIEYVNTLKEGEGLTEEQIREGYEKFKKEKFDRQITEIADKYGIDKEQLREYIFYVTGRLIFDIEGLAELIDDDTLHWKERAKKEEALIQELIPLLKKIAKGQEISGLEYYEYEK